MLPLQPAIPRRPLPETYWVLPGQFLAGEYPGSVLPGQTRLRLQALLDSGLTHFFDLTEPRELPPYDGALADLAAQRGQSAVYRRFPTPDFDVPPRAQMQTLLDALEGALAAGEGVYLHCWGGVGRTGTAVGCFLVRRGLTGPEALDQLSRWWQEVPKRRFHPRSPETEAQREYILNWRE